MSIELYRVFQCLLKGQDNKFVWSAPKQGMLFFFLWFHCSLSPVFWCAARAGPDSFAAGAGDMANVPSWHFRYLHISTYLHSQCSFRDGIEQGNYEAVDANRLQDTTRNICHLKNRQMKAEVDILDAQGRDLCCIEVVACLTCRGGGREMCGWCHWICTSTCPSGGQQSFSKLTWGNALICWISYWLVTFPNITGLKMSKGVFLSHVFPLKSLSKEV